MLTPNVSRHKIIPAVFLILRKGDQVLLQQRANTGHEDGKYSLVGGHLEGNESATVALCREIKEEIGIDVQVQDLKFAYVLHKQTESERIDLFFVAEKWQGTPHICEPDKSTELKFFPLNNLPNNTIAYIAQALGDIQKGIRYGEYGWK